MEDTGQMRLINMRYQNKINQLPKSRRIGHVRLNHAQQYNNSTPKSWRKNKTSAT